MSWPSLGFLVSRTNFRLRILRVVDMGRILRDE